MSIDKGTHQRKLCSKNLDEAFCILKVTGVLIEKTRMYIFSKIQLFEVQPFTDPESYVTVRGWRADNGPTLNAGLVALWFFRRSGPVLLRNPIFLWFFRGVWTPCPPSGSAHDNQGSVLKVLCQTCGNIGDITSKKYAEEKRKNKSWLSETILLSIRFSHAKNRDWNLVPNA